jgi:DNA repair exonuclease SbcCD ATPase subunit
MLTIKEQLANCNQQIKDTEQIISDLRNQLNQQSTAREQAEEKLRTLIEQKTKMEADLNQAQGQINEIIEKITQINDSLIAQIALIDDIVLEIDDTTGESVESHFKDISDNIQSIIVSLDNPSNQPPSNQPPGNQQKGNQAPRDKYRPVDPSKTGFTYKGGKSRKVKKINKRKTNKKYKHRGGYVYKPVSQELKKSSSVILSGVSDSGIITGTSVKKTQKRH